MMEDKDEDYTQRFLAFCSHSTIELPHKFQIVWQISEDFCLNMKDLRVLPLYNYANSIVMSLSRGDFHKMILSR